VASRASDVEVEVEEVQTTRLDSTECNLNLLLSLYPEDLETRRLNPDFLRQHVWLGGLGVLGLVTINCSCFLPDMLKMDPSIDMVGQLRVASFERNVKTMPVYQQYHSPRKTCRTAL
jgi:hypothetical protein